MGKEICPRCGKEQDKVHYVCTCGIMYVDLLTPTLRDVLSDEERKLIKDVFMEAIVCKRFIREKQDRLENLIKKLKE